MTSADSIMNIQMLYDALKRQQPTTTPANINIPANILDDYQRLTTNKDAKSARTSFIQRMDEIVAIHNIPWSKRTNTRVCWSPIDALAIHVILSTQCLMCDSQGW